MALTKSLNSKANIKQFSNADFPVNPKQPVIARHSTTSTASQTVINLPWMVDTINAQDSFFLSVDGKILTLGAANDYTMTSVDGIGFSNQVTLTQSLTAGLNIQAWKLGLKKESEFAQDSRFIDIYDNLSESFQSYVKTSTKINATTTTGTPAAGTFYSTITNRASLPDLSADLKPRMGIERIPTQSIYQLQDEFGPNGEPVWGVVNDTLGQIRFVGNCQSFTDTTGQGTNLLDVTTAYIEVTFYGTGLNALMYLFSATNVSTYSVDGATPVTFTSNQATTSGVLTTRNYSSNQIVPIISGLTLGIHTVKIAHTSITGSPKFYGFEILNESSSVKTNPGVTYGQGRKVTTSAQDATTYNAPVTGTKGGRVVVYQAADSSIGRVFRAVNTSQLTLASADHTNEEVARTYNVKEFGAGRADDFSISTASGTYTFTLDDGTTTLAGSSVTPFVIFNGSSGIAYNNPNGFVTLTFVGTGLDIIMNSTTANTVAVTLDGTSIGSITSATSGVRTYKVASGLPYGTHTAKFLIATASGITVNGFVAYQPKKPTLPSLSVELADYNVMADYASGIVSGNIDALSTGVLHKQSSREFNYVGTWTIGAPSANVFGAQFVSSSTIGSYFEYTFFGTGINIIAAGTGSTSTVQIDGVNYTGAATAVGTGSSWTPGTSTWAAASTNGAGLIITGLTLGLHKVRVTLSNAVAFFLHGIHIITPIYSVKSNVSYDPQNTLSIGSNGISDNRKISAIKELNNQTKNISQAVKLANSTTTSTTFVPIADMSVTHTNKSGKIRILHSGVYNGGVPGGYITIYINGSPIKQGNGYAFILPTTSANCTITTVENVPIGTNKIEVYYRAAGAGTITAFNDGQVSMILTVEEV